MLCPNRLGAGSERNCFVAPVRRSEECNVVLQTRSYERVLWPKLLLSDRERPLVERLRLGVAALGPIEIR